MYTTKYIADEKGNVQAWKVSKMCRELELHPRTCFRVPLVKDAALMNLRLCVNVCYVNAIAYDYPCYSFEVFSTYYQDVYSILKHMKDNHDEWRKNGEKLSDLIVEKQSSVPKDIAFTIYKFISFEPPKIKFNIKLLGTNFGLTDSFLCGCIRCFENPHNKIWKIENVTDEILLKHLTSEEHRFFAHRF